MAILDRFPWGLLVLVVTSGYVPLSLLVWWVVSVRRGLRSRTSRRFAVHVERGVLEIIDDARRRSVQLCEVARARFAYDDSWTQSRLVEDALTLFDRRGHRLEKIPASAEGWAELRTALDARGVPVEAVEVAGPVYLD